MNRKDWIYLENVIFHYIPLFADEKNAKKRVMKFLKEKIDEK